MHDRQHISMSYTVNTGTFWCIVSDPFTVLQCLWLILFFSFLEGGQFVVVSNEAVSIQHYLAEAADTGM